MSLNTPCEAYTVYEICVRAPAGARTFPVDAAEASRYNADPDGWAAEEFGLSREEYLEWVRLDGQPLCAGRNRFGRACRCSVGRVQFDAGPWKERHRRLFCYAHGGELANDRDRAKSRIFDLAKSWMKGRDDV